MLSKNSYNNMPYSGVYGQCQLKEK